LKIVVDLFNQHSGDMNELKRLALSAFINGADVAKIQILNSQRIWGDDSRKYLEMTYEQVKDFYNFCKTHSIEFSATVFDEEKLEWLDDFEVDWYKIASVTAKKDVRLVEKILAKNKPTIISLGMYDKGEFPFGFNDNINYLYCVSEYPTYLNNQKIKDMPNEFSKATGFHGYSDHSVGTAPALQAYLRGAKFLEKHFTFNNFNQRSCEKAHLGSFTPDSLKSFTNLLKEFEAMKS